MADGENHAKRIVLQRAERLSERLQEEGTADPRTWGEAFDVLLSMITPLYMAAFVTKEDCEEYRLGLTQDVEQKQDKEDCEQLHQPKEKSQIPFKLGPMTFQVASSSCFGMFLLFLYFVGKGKNWW